MNNSTAVKAIWCYLRANGQTDAADMLERLQEQVAALKAENRLLLTAHKAGEKISRDSDDQSWKNWVDACRKIEAALDEVHGT